MMAMEAALDYAQTLERQRGYQRILHQGRFSDDRGFVLVVGRYISMLFIDHAFDVSVHALRRLLPYPDDAFGLFTRLKRLTTLEAFEAEGFRPLESLS